ncbi:MAG: glycine--tRNA ligase subunit beta [Chloroflexi bacterium]|nr:glycine--tRNA ligase subunit beta [Chloroflexota bacterium]
MDSQDKSFQNIIQKLNEFWANHDCVLWQPYNVQVGAGTNNPATLLRVLGPEPWRVAYVEPSIRPDDGRYAENPNRMQRFYQYQVILKPDPGNSQELYLASLEYIGIDPREHDIRFVEDNWESPALGAWGLGWEVWLDGQEITQFTYFQQAGGLNAEPVSVEITYGLERIVLALQGADAVWDINMTKGITYGDVFKQDEIEYCRYYFEIAGVDALKQTYDVYEEEYKRALDAGAVVPAYDYILKCSHLFNVLDTRGAIGVTERAQYFRRMRDMTRNIAKAYLQQREALDYPFMEHMDVWGPVPESEPTVVLRPEVPVHPADMLVEIGTEELPAGDLADALAQLHELVPEMLGELRLDYESFGVYGTPRRLVVVVRNLAHNQRTEVKEISGPPVNRAYDEKGKPTPAAIGFAKGQGVDVKNLRQKEIKGGLYVVAEVTEVGQGVIDVMEHALPQLVAAIKFNKSMRWNDSGVTFSRPIRWLMAMFGEHNVRFTYAGLISKARSRGLRPMGSPEFNVISTADYLTQIEERGIILDPDARRAEIQRQITALGGEVDGTIPDDPALLDEVTNLVERPTAFRGSFPAKYLDLPREVLVTVMRKHQRYFAIQDDEGSLLPFFIAVRNGDDEHLDIVREGNEHVLIARFSDAEFFYTADIQQPLEMYLQSLSTLTFQEQLGSMLDKNNRVRDMVPAFAELMEVSEKTLQIAEKAASIAKADLGTQMVVEMTSLQGTMGRIYARQFGQAPAVAEAIFEHWLPRSADDILPQSEAGILLALLDRLDSLVGLFGAGLAPTGSTDPFALRRAALGIVQILLGHNIELDLKEAVNLVAEYQPIEISAETRAEVIDFIKGRLQVILSEEGHPHDILMAVLAEQGHNPVRAVQGVPELEQWVQHEDWEYILDSYARCKRIVREFEPKELHPERFTEEAEKELFNQYIRLNHRLHPQEHNVDRFLAVFSNLVPYITKFFDDILVMDENEAIRDNRLALLQHIAGMANGYADMSQLQGF